jgi:hypothetical protein
MHRPGRFKSDIRAGHKNSLQEFNSETSAGPLMEQLSEFDIASHAEGRRGISEAVSPSVGPKGSHA